ncbi:MAG TPA: PEGA domain-containing protein [Polyangiaceae bacterium]|jgi:hypothetical protein
MRVRTLVAVLALAFAPAATPRLAYAAPPGGPAPTAADLATAKKLFQTGLKLYNEGSYREALASFEKADAIAPRASLQRNIAQCHRDLKEFAEAYDAYGVLLAKFGSSMSAADRRSVMRAIEELGTLTGGVRVTVTEPAATVTIDDRDVGTTPLPAPLRVNLGAHVVTVHKAGLEPIRKEVRLSGGDEVTVGGSMRPEVTTGHLVVNAPPGTKVEVFVDGADVGPAPWEGDVKPGAHVVESKGPGEFSAPRTIEVPRHERIELALELASSAGRVQIDAHIADAAVAIDGKEVGKGVWEGTLPAGEHTLVIEAPGYRPYTRPFLVHAGETFVEDARLESVTGEAPPRYEGLYSGLAFFGFATPTGASNGLAKDCPGAPCTTSSPLGAGLGVRVGYSFGWIAVEGLAFGSYDHSSGTDTYGAGPSGVARDESYEFHRFGGGVAVGARVASKDPHLRFTGALLGGFATMGTIFRQDASTPDGASTSEQTSGTQSYTAPLLAMDAGVLVGWANGAKLHVSLLTMLQFVGGPVYAPGFGTTNLATGTFTSPALSVAQGTQVFLGPMLGFDFGL